MSTIAQHDYQNLICCNSDQTAISNMPSKAVNRRKSAKDVAAYYHSDSPMPSPKLYASPVLSPQSPTFPSAASSPASPTSTSFPSKIFTSLKHLTRSPGGKASTRSRQSSAQQQHIPVPPMPTFVPLPDPKRKPAMSCSSSAESNLTSLFDGSNASSYTSPETSPEQNRRVVKKPSQPRQMRAPLRAADIYQRSVTPPALLKTPQQMAQLMSSPPFDPAFEHAAAASPIQDSPPAKHHGLGKSENSRNKTKGRCQPRNAATLQMSSLRPNQPRALECVHLVQSKG